MVGSSFRNVDLPLMRRSRSRSLPHRFASSLVEPLREALDSLAPQAEKREAATLVRSRFAYQRPLMQNLSGNVRVQGLPDLHESSGDQTSHGRIPSRNPR